MKRAWSAGEVVGLSKKDAVIIPAEFIPFPFDFEGTQPNLKELQTAVGGFIEVVRVPLRPHLVLVVDEDGHRHERPPNLIASAIARQLIVGDAVLMRESLLR